MAQKYASQRRSTFRSEWREPTNKLENNKTDIQQLLNDVRQNYSGNLKDDDVTIQPGETTLTDSENAVDAAINNLPYVNIDDKKGCGSCSTAVRVEHVSQFAPGQHISMPGKYSSIASYRHHAIVKEVKHKSGTCVTLELIEFDKKEFVKNIYKSEKTFDLKDDEMYIVQYMRPRYTPDEIVRRAESKLPENTQEPCKFDRYNPLTNNCEHFATWCDYGEGQSFQVQGIRKRINDGLQKIQSYASGYWVGKYLFNILLVSSDEMAGIVTNSLGGRGQGIALTTIAALYLIYCIVMTVCHIGNYKKGKMCRRCLKRNLLDMWLDFATFCGTSVASYIILVFAIPLISSEFGIPLAILTILLAISLQCAVSKVKRMLQSPFSVDKNMVEELSEIDIGDVISMRYWGIMHDMIVTEVQVLTDNTAKIRCVHYSLPTWNIFGTRTILEEWFNVDVSNAKVSKYDCRHVLAYTKEEVAKRARRRVGETKWNWFSNRSDHFCYWAKVKQLPSPDYDDSYNMEQKGTTNMGNIFLEEKEIHLFSDLRLGDAIWYDESGILVGKTCLDEGCGRLFEIEIIFWKLWSIRCQKYTIDLNSNTLMVRKYHPANCRPMKERVRLAQNAKREGSFFLTFARFMEHCIIA